MIKVCYSELDGPKGLSLRLEAAGHAGYAPAGQDIVCAGASTLMQALVYLLAGEENARSDAWDEPEGPRLAVAAQAPVAPWVQGAFELAKAGFTLLAERYPDNLRFADVSRSGQQSMMDLQLFAEGEAAPALSPEQTRQAVAAGTLKPEATAAQPEAPQQTPAEPEPQPEKPAQPERPALPSLPLPVQNTVRGLHARWAAEEAAMRRSQPSFDLKAELKNPEMRRLMQALVYLLAGEENARSDAWDEPEGPRLAVAAQAPVAPWVQGAFELAKAGFTLLAERYPDNLRFADVSRSGQQSMMDLQLFAEGEAAPALSPEQTRQAVAAGTLKPEATAAQPEAPQQTPAEPEPQPEKPAQPERPALPSLPLPVQNTVRGLHARWAAEEAAMRRSQPSFDLKAELKNPEMRRLMQLPGMRVQDAYRLAHYEDAMRTTAQTVEQGVVERVQQRAARPLENGLRPGAAASVRPDVAAMTRAQREALERRVLHGAQIEL